MKNNGNKPAFQKLSLSKVQFEDEMGLTKREYFAAMAMQGLCANSFYAKIEADKGMESKTDYCTDHILAVRSVEIADELLKQLES